MPDSVSPHPDDPPLLTAFATALATRDPATVRAYLTTLRHFVAWLATTPSGTPFPVGNSSSSGCAICVAKDTPWPHTLHACYPTSNATCRLALSRPHLG